MTIKAQTHIADIQRAASDFEAIWTAPCSSDEFDARREQLRHLAAILKDRSTDLLGLVQ